MPPYSILLLIFSAAILLYAGILAVTKDYNALPWRATVSVTPKDPKKYTFQLSKVIALVAIAPAVSGVVSIWSGIGAGIVFVVGLVVLIWLGTKMMKDVM